jgi:hypothetical protein
MKLGYADISVPIDCFEGRDLSLPCGVMKELEEMSDLIRVVPATSSERVAFKPSDTVVNEETAGRQLCSMEKHKC